MHSGKIDGHGVDDVLKAFGELAGIVKLFTFHGFK